MDKILLYTQSIVALIIIVSELGKGENLRRNLLVILFLTTFLFLCNFQAIWAFNSPFLKNNGMIHISQSISEDSIILANRYSGLFLAFFAMTYKFLQAREKKRAKSLFRKVVFNFNGNIEEKRFLQKRKVRLMPSMSSISYLMIYFIVLTCFSLIVILSGGIKTFLASPGALGFGGSSSLLIFLGLGKMPLLNKLIARKKLNINDYLLFLSTFIITLLNSRFMAGFIILQVFIIINYFVKPIDLKKLITLLLVFLLIFIVYGVYRDNSNFYDYSITGFLERIVLVFDRLNNGWVLVIDWFYGFNVEAFIGLAGAINYGSKNLIYHDLGISNLSIFTALIPSFIRNDPILPFRNIHEFFLAHYPYSGSIVPGGLESFFVHFGFIGIPLLGILTSYLVCFLHRNLCEKTVNTDLLVYSLLSTHILNLIRNSLSVTLFFFVGDLLVVYLYKLIVSIGRSKSLGCFD